MGRKQDTWLALLICLTLAAGTLFVYWPVFGYGFINYDDSEYITQNYHVRAGLTWAGMRWAFASFHACNWHPVTWLSHMLDWQIFGSSAGGHHQTNVLIHLLNSLLLLGLLLRLTGSIWRSSLVAGLFALHPLQVESVAWISERKNLLSVFFGLLCLWAYARYTNVRVPLLGSREKIAVDDRQIPHGLSARAYFVLSLFFFALGLMSKPMVVTLPFVMLLLDWWPLQRFGVNKAVHGVRATAPGIGLLVEKLPFFVLSTVLCIVTVLAQKSGGAVQTMQTVPFGARLGNATVAYALYAWKTVWPTQLAAFYPHPGSWPLWQVAVAAVSLLLVTGAVLTQTRACPALLTGWLWFMGTLVPVIGLIQVGNQSRSDRYMYLPVIGLFLAIAWTSTELLLDAAWREGDSGGGSSFRRSLSKIARIVIVAIFLVALGSCTLVTRTQVQYWRDGVALFTRTLAVTPQNPFAHFYLGNALVEKGRVAEGIQHLEKSVLLDPQWPEAHNSLAFALGLMHDLPAAAAHYRRAIELKPDFAAALNNLAWMLSTAADDRLRNGTEAIRFADNACRLTGFQNNLMVGTLAAAYAECGRFSEAVALAEKARDLAISSGDQSIAKVHQELSNIYRSGRPYHEPAQR
jgi:hypothetical protein